MKNGEIKQRLIGFHLRVLPVACAAEIWTPRNRELYLLNPSIDYPLTADEMMWPGLDENEQVALLDAFMKKKGYSWKHLCSDVALLRDIPEEWFTESFNKFSDKAWLIAVSVDPAVANELELIYSSLNLSGMSISDLIALNWCFIGYDIMDQGSISGLMNCSYQASEKDALAEYTLALNSYGLFSSQSRAKEFCEITGRRVSAHAPFHIAGLWVHPSNNGLDIGRCIDLKV